MHYKKSLGGKVADIIIYSIMIILSFIFLYPIINTISLSLSEASALGGKSIKILPRGFSLEAYKYLLSKPIIFRYYYNTILYAVSGTLLTLLVTSLIAYPLADSNFFAKKAIGIYLVITMFLNGGLIPTYMLYHNLHLKDTIWAMILPGVSAYNIMVYKTFFRGLPEALKDAAKIDGASHFHVLFRVVIPLSKPLLATMSLFSLAGHWNGYFTALLYLDDTKMHPIQMYLRRLLSAAENSGDPEMAILSMTEGVAPRSVQAAIIMIAMIPILCVYPFLQKYFTKGVLVGSVKE